MRRTIAIGVILLFLWLAYSVWPFFAVYRLASAVQVRDVEAVKVLVDGPARITDGADRAHISADDG
jgi:DUF2939 family protein